MSVAHAPSTTEDAPTDYAELQAALSAEVRGEVRFDSGSKSIYAVDASNYRQVPIGVVIPRDAADVVRAVAICARFKAPILGRGAGTSLAGQCCNVAVVLDFSKYMNRIIEFNPAENYAWVEPGIILDDLRNLAETKGLTFGPDPATHDRCTVGGMIGNNSCGVHSVMAGRTVDNIEELEILTYDGARFKVGATAPEELAKIVLAGGRKGDIYSKLRDLRNRTADEVRRKFPRIPRRVSGYNLDELLDENGFHVARALVGTEGTCAIVLAAKVRLVASPPGRALLVLGYPDVYRSADHVPQILKHKPVGLEGMDDYLLDFLRKKRAERVFSMRARPSSDEDRPAPASKDAGDVLPDGHGWLLVEFGGDTLDEAYAKCRGLMSELGALPDAPTMKMMEDPAEEAMVWEVRKSGLGATAFLPGNRNTWPGWEDAAVPPDRLGQYLREFDVLRKKYSYECAMYGHFGDGCVHMRINFDMVTAAGIAAFKAFLDEAADLVVRHGGSLSGEHGDGQARAHLLPKMFGPELVDAFREFKLIWDPQNRMNPGKVVDAFAPDENLRLGAGYESWRGETMFSFPESDNSFGRALLRCVGVGKCRRVEGGTMCPSFMATREEKHSTRGRAHLLFDMLRGDTIKDGWNSTAVRESLDLCLSCKGCKTDCPVNVDLATYKAEFLYHYYKRRLRPRQSYAMGLIYWWARITSYFPAMANFITSTPLTAFFFRLAGGISKHRPLPQFAPQTFRRWYFGPRTQGVWDPLATDGENHAPRTSGSNQPATKARGKVILWVDTFNNHFTPPVAQAALRVLESAGFEVIIPRKQLCCGRPLYDHGFLGLAKKLLHEILVSLRHEILAGTPVVGLEPSCISVFRDELVSLFPHNEVAAQLRAQTFTIAEFLDQFAPGWTPPHTSGAAILHTHCHQKSVLTTAPDSSLLRRMGLQVQIPDSGCCGMAGAFGFDTHNFEISKAIGERVLLPAARAAAPETVIITDGFSCREQIEQLAGRQPLHIAQVLDAALEP